MKAISYISTISIPLIIVIVVIYGIKEKKNVYELFIEGAKDGMNTVIQLFPTLLAIFLAIGMIRHSGILECLINSLESVSKQQVFPVEIFPLAILKPISGSASIAVGTEILKNTLTDIKIVTIFLRVPKDELQRRLENRVDRLSHEEIKLRLNRFDYEESKIGSYDYVIKNDNLEKTVSIIRNIIEQECKVDT
mgnify:CR=1 FL=1